MHTIFKAFYWLCDFFFQVDIYNLAIVYVFFLTFHASCFFIPLNFLNNNVDSQNLEKSLSSSAEKIHETCNMSANMSIKTVAQPKYKQERKFVLHLFCVSIYINFDRSVITLFRMGLFEAANRWRGLKKPPSLKFVTHIRQ